MSETVDAILDFWLREVPESAWYSVDAALDQTIRDRFQPVWEQGRAGQGADWPLDPPGALAACILFDQFPRNMFRGSPDAFATDALALSIARRAIRADLDLEVPLPGRQFFYMPFMHSESLDEQDNGIALITGRLGMDDTLLHARAHREIIRRFGRFPFRNEALGRTSTPEEEVFMDSGGYPALVREIRAEPGA